MDKKDDKPKKSFILLLAGFILILGYSFYFTSCTQTTVTKETMTPEHQKAIEDSLLKIREFEITKYLSTGHEYYKNKNYRDAKRYFLRIIRLDPEMKLAKKFYYKNIHGLLAQCYIKENKPDSTEWAFREGLKHYDDNAYYHESLGYLSRKKNDFDQAILQYEKASELLPEKSALYKTLGELYYQTNKTDKAIEAYESLLKLEPKNREAEQKLAAMLRSAGREEDMIARQEKMLADKPDDTKLMFDLGKTYYRNYEYKKALQKFETLAQKQPDNIEALRYLANVQLNLEQYNAAIATLKKMNSIEPGNVETMCSIANVYRTKKSFQIARTWARKAMKVAPGNGLPYITIGDIYSSTVEYCADKRGGGGFDINDKLIYELAYSEYQKAKKDPAQISTAQKKIEALKVYLPTKEDKFMHQNQKKAKGNCYQWIY